MAVYVEDPVEPIVGVHWRKKKKDGTGTGPPGETGNVCASYSYSVVCTQIGHLITDAPDGPAPPPFGGSFQLGGFTLEAAPWGQIAIAMELAETTINFTTPQIMEFAARYPLGSIIGRYFVSMIVGHETIGYNISVTWASSAFGGGSWPYYGLGFGNEQPSEPVTSASAETGALSYFYDWRANGDGVLWWLVSNDGVDFSAPYLYVLLGHNDATGFPDGVTAYPGDRYSWTISAVCGAPLSGT